jgi:hypothetical protein
LGRWLLIPRSTIAGVVISLLGVPPAAGFAPPQEGGLRAAAHERRCAPARSAAVISYGSVTFDKRTHRLYPEVMREMPAIPSPLTAADGTELMVALARPGRLSTAGFLGANDGLVSVLRADNRTVTVLGLTHPDLARPLFHLLNMMQADIDLGRWDMAVHRWHNVASVISHGRTVRVIAGDTKGGQPSIFADGLDGSSWLELTGEMTVAERAFLKARYSRLTPREMHALVQSLTCVKSGDMEPFYITRYGFYEGATPWRTDPVALAFVFGLRTLEQIEAAFPGRLYDLMMTRFVPFEPGDPEIEARVAGIWR